MSERNSIEEIEGIERYMSLKEACKFLSVSPGFVYKYRHSIPCLKVGGSKSGKLLFLASELRAWAESHRIVKSDQTRT